MRVLIDTNIIIKREDYRKIELNTIFFFKNARKNNYSIVYHPKQLDDINKDKNLSRKENTLSKIKIYDEIEFDLDPNKDSDFMAKIGVPKKNNDEIDNHLLYALYRDAVEFLITEDLEIHKKADKLSISDRVFTIDEISYAFRDLEGNSLSVPLFLKEREWATLDLLDPFFDSLKVDYPDFEKWFRQKSRKGRKGWIYQPKTQIEAICLWKVEQNESVKQLLLNENFNGIKICTMKVQSFGKKIGELFLQLIFELARTKKLDYVYVSAFPDKENLILMLEQFGFVKKGKNEAGEDYYLKELKPNGLTEDQIQKYPPLEFSKLYYPSLLIAKSDIYTIPIRPQFYDILFNQIDRKQTRLTSFISNTQIPGNTIKKAYISKAVTTQLRAGDLLTFYRSQDKQAIVSIGIVEEVHTRINDLNKAKILTRKRTVYSDKEINQLIQESTNGITVILFRHHFYLDRLIIKDEAIERKILNGPPQALTKIDNRDEMIKLLKENINGSDNYIY